MAEVTARGQRTVYSLHGNLIGVQTGDGVLADAAMEALGELAAPGDADGPALEVQLYSVGDPGQLPRPSSTAQVVGKPSPVNCAAKYTLLKDGGRWLLDFDERGLFSLDLVAGSAEGWLVAPDRMPIDGVASFVLAAAIELLRTRGVYAIHGAALERDGQGVLIVGPSGSGKTTACLALTRAGYRCLSDDHPLFRWKENGPELLWFAGRIAVTDRTIAWFPELQAAQDLFRRDTRKRSFDLQEIRGYRPVGGTCRPALILFPRITECAESVLEPMAKTRALEELLPQTLVVMDPALAARHFHTMAALIQATPTYRLHFGEDPARLPELVDPLLKNLASG